MKETLNDEKIKELLLKGNYLNKEDLEAAEKQAKGEKLYLADYLLKNDLITKDLLGQAIAEFFRVKYADLNSSQPSKEQALKIPERIAKKYHLVLFQENKDGIVVTTDNPTQKGLKGAVSKALKTKKIKIAFSLREDIEAILQYYQKALATRFSRIIKSKQKIAPEILDEIVKDALALHASDIHFEPQENEVILRFRIDGVLQEAGQLPKEYYENVINKIKVQANLRIDEHFAAQDGSIRFKTDESMVDMRISIVPTIEGEKIAIRLLSQYTGGLNLANLGLSEKDQGLIAKAAHKPFGMILATGPTGSGKTTTLYAVLKTLNKPGVNITTIEDPVEYKIAQTNQIQVNEKTHLTFAKGLRTIVRQDPDIILVGEIRDRETSEIAVNAALTGHLLLSTFHANNAATAIPRLLDMGIEPFLLASTLEVVMAQRLVRRLCESCRYGYTEKDVPSFKNMRLYKSKGCAVCNGLGYKGRAGIFEIIEISQEIKDLILKNPSSSEIWNLAKKQGARSLFDDGVAKVKDGTTSLEELLRVAEPL